MAGGIISCRQDDSVSLRWRVRFRRSNRLNDRFALFDFYRSARSIGPLLRPSLVPSVVAHVRLARLHVARRFLSRFAACAAKLYLKPLAKLPVFRGDSLIVFRCISADVASYRHRLPLFGLLSPIVGHAVLVGAFESVRQFFFAGSAIGILDSTEAQWLKHVATGIARFMDFRHSECSRGAIVEDASSAFIFHP